jgi:RimJ/RimL family protein N-acetyltransferase
MIEVVEIKSWQRKDYKEFFLNGLLNDEDNFRIATEDENNAPFPTKDRDDSFTLSAYLDNCLAGVVSFTRDGTDRIKLRHKGILFRMYVSPVFRGKGIGKVLVKAVIERVRTNTNIEQINLTVIASNSTAKKLYEQVHFVTFSSERNAIKWKGKYFTEDQMVLFLNKPHEDEGK